MSGCYGNKTININFERLADISITLPSVTEDTADYFAEQVLEQITPVLGKAIKAALMQL